MNPMLPSRQVALRRRPMDDSSFEDVCMVLNFETNSSEFQTPLVLSQNVSYLVRSNNAVKRRPDNEQTEQLCKLLCFEDSEFDFYESDYESDMTPPSTPTNKPTVLASTNAPARPMRF